MSIETTSYAQLDSAGYLINFWPENKKDRPEDAVQITDSEVFFALMEGCGYKDGKILPKREGMFNSWEEVRIQRNDLLAECDYTQLADYPAKAKKAWKTYRKKLRDITETFESPQDVVWPEKPEC